MEYVVKHLDHTDKRIKKIALNYGYDRQSIKLIEEMESYNKLFANIEKVQINLKHL